jgi:hypothetical protein
MRNALAKQATLQKAIAKANSMAELNPLAKEFFRPRAIALFVVTIVDAVFVGLGAKTYQEDKGGKGIAATYLVEILTLVFAVLALVATVWQMFGLSRVGLISVIIAYAGKSALSWAFIGTLVGFFGWVQGQTANLVFNIIFGILFALFAYTAGVLYTQFDRVSHIPGTAGTAAADAEEKTEKTEETLPGSTGMTRQ